MMAERCVNISHNTIPRLVQRFVQEFEERWMWKGCVNSETVKQKC